jgi:myosin heavy subunit
MTNDSFLSDPKHLKPGSSEVHDLVSAVTNKKVVIARSEIMSELDEVNAMAARDSFSKILYELLSSGKGSIDVLDIFGFEYFPHNSFEQLW